MLTLLIENEPNRVPASGCPSAPLRTILYYSHMTSGKGAAFHFYVSNSLPVRLATDLASGVFPERIFSLIILRQRSAVKLHWTLQWLKSVVNLRVTLGQLEWIKTYGTVVVKIQEWKKTIASQSFYCYDVIIMKASVPTCNKEIVPLKHWCFAQNNPLILTYLYKLCFLIADSNPIDATI